MDLPVAQLGYAPTINLGGYIPAPAYRPSPMQQAIAAFLSGAAGAAGSKITDAALTKDYSGQASQDAALQQQGMAPQKQGFAGRMLTPMSAQDYERMRGLADEKSYRTGTLAREDKKIGLQKEQINNERDTQSSRMALEVQKMIQGGDQFGQELGQRKVEAGAKQIQGDKTLKLQEAELAQKGPLVGAEARHYNAEAGKGEALNRTMRDSYLQNQIMQMTKGQPSEKAANLVKAADSLAAEGKTLESFPDNSSWNAAVTQRASDMAKQKVGVSAPTTSITRRTPLQAGLDIMNVATNPIDAGLDYAGLGAPIKTAIAQWLAHVKNPPPETP